MTKTNKSSWAEALRHIGMWACRLVVGSAVRGHAVLMTEVLKLDVGTEQAVMENIPLTHFRAFLSQLSRFSPSITDLVILQLVQSLAAIGDAVPQAC